MLGEGFVPAVAALRHWHGISTATHGPVPAQSSWGTSMTFPSANLCIYTPVFIGKAGVIKKLWYSNNNTATGNYDIGLYDVNGVAIIRRGSTAKTTTTLQIIWDCTDTVIAPGLYYFALASDSSSDTFFGISVTAPLASALGVWTEAAFPLPATATFAIAQALAEVPLGGAYFDTRVS